MTPQERDVIAGIFDRLRQAADQPRDPEAERFITQKLQEQPYAPYAMAQAVYVQEQALTNLQAQVEQLQAQVEALSRAPQPAQQSGGFLSGIFGGGAQPQRPGSVPSFPPRTAQAQPSDAWNTQQRQQTPAGPWGGQAGQQGAAPAARGNGFMATALSTAAGVAGGMMLGNILTNAFGNHGGSAQAADAKTADASDSASSDSQPASLSGDSGQSDEPQGYEEPSSFDDGMDGGMFDDGGDWV